MFVKRENNPERSEWIDELFYESNYRIVKREESGDYEVYFKNKMIARTESYKTAREYVMNAIGNS